MLSYVRAAQLFLQPHLVSLIGQCLIPYLSHRPWWITVSYHHHHHRYLLLSIIIDQGMTGSLTRSLVTDVGSSIAGARLAV